MMRKKLIVVIVSDYRDTPLPEDLVKRVADAITDAMPNVIVGIQEVEGE